jgi:glyoxylate/hydroxypyruvate reductase A
MCGEVETMSLYLDVLNRQQAWREALALRCPDHRVVEPGATPELIHAARYALVWKHEPGVFARMPALEAVFVLGAGVEHTLADPSLPTGIPIVRLHDAGMAEQMVEYHLYAALHYQREFDRYLIDEAEHRWRPRPPQPRLRVGMLGLGALGSAVARALIDLGFPVRAWTRTPQRVAGPEVHAGLGTLAEFLAQTELLICLLPHTPETAGLLSRARLSQLRPGAAIINAGRGSLIDEVALLELLDSGHLRGAFLDVSATEPLPDNHRLWRHPAVRITPHIAAATLIEASVDQVADNIARLERGEAPLGRVDLDAGY